MHKLVCFVHECMNVCMKSSVWEAWEEMEVFCVSIRFLLMYMHGCEDVWMDLPGGEAWREMEMLFVLIHITYTYKRRFFYECIYLWMYEWTGLIWEVECFMNVFILCTHINGGL
jgi:hypothetical protein